MKTNQFNQVIEAAEAKLIIVKAKKEEKSEVAKEIKSFFREAGIEVTEAQVEQFITEYFQKRKTGEK